LMQLLTSEPCTTLPKRHVRCRGCDQRNIGHRAMVNCRNERHF
jgi:hypothetical protein